MIRYACNPPSRNAELITGDGLSLLGFNSQPQPQTSVLDGFGIQIDPNMAVVPGRNLRQPTLSYKSGQPPRVNNGSWNILDVKFHKGAKVDNKWWCVVINDGEGSFVKGPDDPMLQNLVGKFTAKLGKAGLTMPPGLPTLIPLRLPSPHDDPGRLRALTMIRNAFQKSLEGMARGSKPAFVLVLLHRRDNYIYPGIKVCLSFSTAPFKILMTHVPHSELAMWRWDCIRSICSFPRQASKQSRINTCPTLL